MIFTTIPLVLNTGAGIGVWMSDIPLPAKIGLTALLIGKYALFVYSAWVSDSEKVRKAGVSLCILANVALTIYSIIHAAYSITATAAIILLILLPWSFAAVFDFKQHSAE